MEERISTHEIEQVKLGTPETEAEASEHLDPSAFAAYFLHIYLKVGDNHIN